MGYARLLRLIAVGAAFLVNINSVFADHLASCPSLEDLKALHYAGSFPYGFDTQSKTMKAIVVAENKFNHDKDDDSYVFVVYPLKIQPTDNPQRSLNAVIEKLNPEFNAPVKYKINPKLTLPLCVYTASDDAQVNAIVYFKDIHGEHPDLQAILKLIAQP